MGKSLEDAASAVRVSRRYLAGIEEGKFDGFPERVFSTGFIRSYAKYLEVDPVPVLVEYERTVERQAEGEATTQVAPEWLERERERGSRKTTYTSAAAVVLLLGIVLAWLSMRSGQRPRPAPPPVVEAPAASAPAVAARPQGDAAPTAPPQDSAAPTAPPQDNAAAPLPTVETAGGGGPLTGPFQLFLEASEHTWVMYSIDDGDPIDVTLYAGDKISIQATRHISLKIGNAAGVVATLNGRRLPPFGERGQVRNVTFGQ